MNDREETANAVTPNMPLWSYQLQQDSKMAVRTRKDLEIQLITRALKDKGFKQELMANPKELVEKELGTKLPEGIEIQILEETETTLYMVLPSNPYEGLSEQELKGYLGITYEDVAQWVLEQQRNALLDETSSVAMMARAWRDEAFKKELLKNPITVIEQELGEKVQEDLKIEVLVENAHTLYIILPSILDKFDALNSEIYMLSELNMPMAIGASPTHTRAPNCIPQPNGQTCITI